MKRLCLFVFTALAVVSITMGHISQVDAAHEAAKWRLKKGQTLSHRYWSSPALRQQFPNPDDYYRAWAAANNRPEIYTNIWPDEYLDPPVESVSVSASEAVLPLEPLDPRPGRAPDNEIAALREEVRALTTLVERIATPAPALASTAIAPPVITPASTNDSKSVGSHKVLAGILAGIENLKWIMIIGLVALAVIILILYWLSGRRVSVSEPINRLVGLIEWEFSALRQELQGIRNLLPRAEEAAPESNS